jgi:hypothetical protein
VNASPNEMTRAAALLEEIAGPVPGGQWHASVLGARRYPQRVTNSRGVLVAECYEDPAHPPVIALYLASMSRDFAMEIARQLRCAGETWDETVEWRDGQYVHVEGCKGVVDCYPAEGGCDCFGVALQIARAFVAQAVTTAGEW